MPDSTATPLPAPPPSAGGTPQPNLNVLPDAKPKRRSPSSLNRRTETQLQNCLAICVMARKPGFAALLAGKGLDETFINALVNDITAAGLKAQSAADCTTGSKDASRTLTAAEQTLVASLRDLQKAARQKHLPEHPALLENYHVGEDLTASKAVLDSSARDILHHANTERPPGVNTEFIVRVQAEKDACTAAAAMPSTKQAQGEQARQELAQMLRSIVARRKKIQYAADALWTHGRPETVEARREFQLPLKRPYSY